MKDSFCFKMTVDESEDMENYGMFNCFYTSAFEKMILFITIRVAVNWSKIIR